MVADVVAEVMAVVWLVVWFAQLKTLNTCTPPSIWKVLVIFQARLRARSKYFWEGCRKALRPP